MHIRPTLDPIPLHEYTDSALIHHPCVYEGDGENDVETYFENKENGRIYMEMKMELEDNRFL